jgi:peptide-methionine (S)-S-oxide reductase
MQTSSLARVAGVLTLAAGAFVIFAGRRDSAAAAFPVAESGTAPAGALDTAVFAGGCFWGVQAVFQHVKGVESAISGYAGGDEQHAQYHTVSTGTTGHAESVRVIYDPSVVSYGTLLEVFFAVAHDPTQRNRQGPDVGPQYRSAIFYASDAQRKAAESYIAQLTNAHVFARPVVTELSPLHGFYEAEAYHQDYATRHPDDLYIAINDRPKIESLKKQYPALWRDEIHPRGAAN